MDEVKSKPLRLVLIWVIVMFNALFVWMLLQPARSEARHEFRQTHMGSEFTVIFYHNDPASARRASDLAFARIAALDLALSDYNPESELMRLCERAGGPPVKVGDDLFRVLEHSQVMARRSDGAFDPTIGPVVRLWRRATRERKMPDAELLAKARALVGFEKVKLDPEARTVELTARGMKLDLGGIAKGFAAGEALATLRRQGITRALVSGAGDIAVGDPPPNERGWRVGIGPLASPEAEPSRFILVANRSVSTSGHAARFVEIDGVRYSHIVDPRTGLGLTGQASVTVVAPDGATADSLATAVTVLGPGRGLPLVDSIEGAAALVIRPKEGGEETIESKRWASIPVAGPIKPARP